MTTHTKPLSVARAALWVLAIFWLLQMVMTSLGTLFPRLDLDAVSLGGIEVLVLGGGAYLMALAYRSENLRSGASRGFARLVGIRRGHWSWGILGIGLGLAMQFPAGAMQALVERHWPPSAEQLAGQASFLRHSEPGQALALVMMIGFLGPLVEELFYRGVLFQLLKESRGAGIAVGFVSLAFVVVHPLLATWPALLLLSCVLTYLRLRSGNIWPSLGAHVAFNCATLSTVIVGWNIFDGARASFLSLLVGSLFAVGLLVLAHRASSRLEEVA